MLLLLLGLINQRRHTYCCLARSPVSTAPSLAPGKADCLLRRVISRNWIFQRATELLHEELYLEWRNFPTSECICSKLNITGLNRVNEVNNNNDNKIV